MHSIEQHITAASSDHWNACSRWHFRHMLYINLCRKKRN